MKSGADPILQSHQTHEVTSKKRRRDLKTTSKAFAKGDKVEHQSGYDSASDFEGEEETRKAIKCYKRRKPNKTK